MKKQHYIQLCFILFYSFCTLSLSAQEHKVIDRLKHELTFKVEDTAVLDIYFSLAREYMRINPDSSLRYITIGLEEAEKREKLKYKNYLKFALSEYYNYNNDSRGKPLLEEVKQNFIKNDSAGLHFVYGEYARIAANEKNYALAIDYYYKAINHVKHHPKWSSSAIYLYNNLSTLYLDLKKPKKALTYLKKSLKLEKKYNSMSMTIIPYSNIGCAYIDLKEYDSARVYLEKAQEIQKKINQGLVLARIQTNLINTYSHLPDKLEETQKLAHENMAIFRKHGDSSEVSICYLQLANYYNKKDHFQEAIKYLNHATNSIKNLEKGLFMEYYLHKAFHDVYVDMGDFKNAHHHLGEVLKINSENHKDEMERKFEEIEVKYKTAQKENALQLMREKERVTDLELLEKEAKIRGRTYLIVALGVVLGAIILWMYYSRKQKILKIQKRASNLENTALRAQMNPHFLFNALNSIQRIYIEGNIKKANKFMADFSQLMRKILENSSAYKITLAEEIETLRLYMDLEMLRCKNCFNYSISIDEMISPNLKIPPLILQPFIENAIWHGVLPLNDKKGKIEIKIINFDDDYFEVIIKDNGVGFNKVKPSDSKSSRGIEITRQRIKENVEIISSINEGTTISFKLKKDNEKSTHNR